VSRFTGKKKEKYWNTVFSRERLKEYIRKGREEDGVCYRGTTPPGENRGGEAKILHPDEERGLTENKV